MNNRAAMNEPTPEELEAARRHRETMIVGINEAIQEVEVQLERARATDDQKAIAQLSEKLPRLRMKREEVQRGERA